MKQIERTLIILAIILQPLFLFSSTKDSLENIWKDPLLPDSLKFPAFFELISSQYLFNHPDSAFIQAKALAKAARLVENQYWEAKAINLMGITFGVRSNYKNSINYFKQSRTKFLASGDTLMAATIDNNLGLCYRELSNLYKAMELHQRSLKLAKAVADNELIILNYFNLSKCYRIIGNHEKALSYLNEAIEIEGSSEHLCSIYNSLGQLYLEMNRFSEAEQKFEMAISLGKENYDKLNKARAFLGIGSLHSKVGCFTEAFDSLSKAAQLFRELDSPMELSSTYTQIGLLKYKQGDYKAGLDWCKKAKKLALPLDVMETKKDVCHCLYLNQKKLGNWKEALQQHEMFLQFKDSIINKEKLTKLTMLEMNCQFDIEKGKLESDLLAQRLQQSNVNFWSSFFIIVLLFFLILGLYFNQRKKEEHNKALKDKNEALTSKNEELQRFAFITSHDLKEPIRNISLFTDLIQKKKSLNQEYLAFIKSSTRRMYSLIDSIMTFTKLDKKDVRFEEVEMKHVLESVKNNLHAKITSRQVKINTADLPSVYGLKFQITLLFQNLIENAIKYNQASNPTIWIDGQKHPKEVIFTVKDNGIGIDEKYLKKIFDPFAKLSNTYEGNGLGLSIAKNIVERHGGKIWAESQPGKGSVFYISLQTKIKASSAPT